jgi:hypothetical protein
MFHIKRNPSLKSLELFQAIFTIACGDICRLMALVLRASRLLAMAKDTGGLCSIVVSEVFL